MSGTEAKARARAATIADDGSVPAEIPIDGQVTW